MLLSVPGKVFNWILLNRMKNAAFDSVDRKSSWKLLRHYGVPEKNTNIIKSSYESLICWVIHRNQLTKPFHVRTGVRQGYLLFPFMFLLAIDWIMNTATAHMKNGIQWFFSTQLYNLDFADDLALLAHTQQQMQEKTYSVAETSRKLDLYIHQGGTKILKVNTADSTPIMLKRQPLEEVGSFTYLGSTVDEWGGSREDKNRKGQNSFFAS